jgi:hypothetical protein
MHMVGWAMGLLESRIACMSCGRSGAHGPCKRLHFIMPKLTMGKATKERYVCITVVD